MREAEKRKEGEKRNAGYARRLLCAFAVTAALVSAGRTVRAENIAGQLRQMENAATAYAEKDVSSEVLHEFAAGDSVMIIGEEDAWLEIFWQGDTGYIPESDAETAEGEVYGDLEEETAAIQKEMDEQQAAYEAAQEAKKKAMRWRIVMVVLVLAIIAVSLVPAILRFRKEGAAETDEASRTEDEMNGIIDIDKETEDDADRKEDGDNGEEADGEESKDGSTGADRDE